jgi:hypothetical protein
MDRADLRACRSGRPFTVPLPCTPCLPRAETGCGGMARAAFRKAAR